MNTTAIDRLSPGERAVIVRAIAAAALTRVLRDVERDREGPEPAHAAEAASEARA